MVMAAVLLDGVVALALLAMAAKYAFGPVPLDYHAAIFKAEGLVLTPATRLVLRAFYLGLAGGFLGLAITTAVLAVGPVSDGAVWAQALITAAGLCMAVPLAGAARRVEVVTGVAIPWRLALVLGALLVLALVLVVAR